MTHLQNVLRGHVAARERRKREQRERKALEEARRLEEEQLREERIREAAMSGNAFGALAGLNMGAQGGGKDNGAETERAETGGGWQQNGMLGRDGMSEREARALSGATAGSSGAKSTPRSNPFGALKEKLEGKRAAESSRRAKSKLDEEYGRKVEPRKYSEGESSDEEELDQYVQELTRAYGDNISKDAENGALPEKLEAREAPTGQPASAPPNEAIRPGRVVKKLGARMKKRPNEVSVPAAVSANVGRLEASPSEEKSRLERESTRVRADTNHVEETGEELAENGNGTTGHATQERRVPVSVAPKSEKDGAAKKGKALSGWKGQLAQLKDLQRR